jgi:hypothetical protein
MIFMISFFGATQRTIIFFVTVFFIAASPLALAQEIPESFLISNTKCPLKFKNPTTNKWEAFKFALKPNLKSSETEKVSAQKTLVKFKIKTKPYEKFVFAGDYKCLSGSAAKSQQASHKRISTKSSQLATHFRFIRERTNYIDTTTTRIEPLFNDLFILSAGWEKILNFSSLEAQIGISALAGLSKVKNADSTPTTPLTQSATLVFGIESVPGLGYRMGSIKIHAGFPLVLRYQKFASSTEGSIEASTLGFLWGTELGLSYQLNNALEFVGRLGLTQLNFLYPQFSVGLNYTL